MWTSHCKTEPHISDDLESLAKDLRSTLSKKELDSIPGIQALRQRAEDGINKVRDSATKATQQAKYAAAATDQYAHDEPWRIAGAALAVGALVGWLMSRR